MNKLVDKLDVENARDFALRLLRDTHSDDDLLMQLGVLAVRVSFNKFIQFWDSPERKARMQRRRTLRGRLGWKWRKKSRKMDLYDLSQWLAGAVDETLTPRRAV